MNQAMTFEAAVTLLQTVLLHIDPTSPTGQEIAARDEVLNAYQPVFAREHLSELTAAEFDSFLLYENNRHWTGLNRHGSQMTADMEQLWAGLDLLLYGEDDIADRFPQAIKMVTGMGRAVASSLLLLMYPGGFGVWNATAEAGLKQVGLWPDFDRGTSIGDRYVAVNTILLRLVKALRTDLWTLDALWWQIVRWEPDGPNLIPGDDDTLNQAFGLERHLQYFLWDNWDHTSLGRDWDRYTEEGNPEAGFEFPCHVGRIDLLAKHRTEPRWLVIELKRGQTGDATAGQVLRYMGWVEKHLALSEEVQGLIIGREPEPGLEYALRMVPNVNYQRYEVQFSLYPLAREGEA